MAAILPTAAFAAPPKDGPRVYTIQYGDTLFSISRRFGTTVPALKAANGLASNLIYAGRQLIIPGDVDIPPPPPTAERFECRYKVEPRDSFYPIAYRYRTDPDDLMRANYMYSPLVFEGQQLRVPCLERVPAPLPRYDLRPDDDLFRLSIRNQTSLYSILLANGIWNPGFVYTGQTLVIPTTVAAVPSAPLVLAPAPGPPTATCQGACSVVIHALAFDPPTLVVSPGTTVIWLNLDPQNHTLIGGTPGIPSNIFVSPSFGTNGSWSFTFVFPGAYPYYDEVQGANMVGTVLVR